MEGKRQEEGESNCTKGTKDCRHAHNRDHPENIFVNNQKVRAAGKIRVGA